MSFDKSKFYHSCFFAWNRGSQPTFYLHYKCYFQHGKCTKIKKWCTAGLVVSESYICFWFWPPSFIFPCEKPLSHVLAIREPVCHGFITAMDWNISETVCQNPIFLLYGYVFCHNHETSCVFRSRWVSISCGQALQNERKQHLQLCRDHRVNQGKPRQPGTHDLDMMQWDYHGTCAAGYLERAVSTIDKCFSSSNLEKYHPMDKKAPESEKIWASENLQSLWHWLITLKLS